MDADSRIRAAIEEHWRASEAGETEAEHAVYAEDAILDYPQSGERFRGRERIAAQRGGHPASRHFTVVRISGGGVFRPFEEGNESWAELVVRTGASVMNIVHRHRGGTAVLVAHGETVESSFHVLGGQALYRAFDLKVAPASITEWVTEEVPTGMPPARWTLCRFSDAT